MNTKATGPEFLDSLADQASANNDSLVADQLRELSKQWKDQQRQLQAAFDDNSRLQQQVDAVKQAVAA